MSASERTLLDTHRLRFRVLTLVLLTLVVGTVVMTFPPIPQDQSYHNFADRRSMLGISNFLDVISNVPFLITGLIGFIFLLRGGGNEPGVCFVRSVEKWPYVTFFLGVTLTCLGSAYYHLAPDNERLVWDRLPMTIAFMSLFAAVIAERISLRAGLSLLAPMLAIGIGSVVHWHLSELNGAGDLRLYILVQFYSMLAIPLIALLFPSRYTRGADIFLLVGLYAVAKIAELLDRPILALGGIVSGHSLKHVIAAIATYQVVVMLKNRMPATAESTRAVVRSI